MPTFTYEGKTLTGEVRKGEIEAASLAVATAALRRQQIITSKLAEKKGGGFALSIPGFGAKVTTKEIVIFTRQFATMIDAGLPLVQCLEILSGQQPNQLFKTTLTEIKKSVEGGSTFADALRRHPKVFDELYVNLVAAGEVGGILDTILNRLAVFMEKSEKLKGKIKGALMYPLVICIIAGIVVAVLLLYVVPIFQGMFADFGSALPAPTQFVVNLSNGLKSYWWAFLGTIIGIVVSIRQFYHTDRGRVVIDGLLLKAPVFGDLLRKTAVARFTRTMATMISSGVPILEALEIVAKTAGNKIVESAIMQTRISLSQGKTLAEPLAATKVFPSMVVQMIGVGEATGALDAMLSKIADFYEEEVDTAVDTLMSLIEPALMAFLGVVVGGLVITMYLPIFKLAGAAGG
ncbi:MAG: pilus assembly protein PilC [Deltaproteobacteria bacterium GWC2_42_51]|nr:MAG: pilus assembly protein PilC [Deltaproteobacteria bacterium GWA2_42_85]OGP29877.1 MAG: pilus assembly protein PilC [Deltaproteobacteria bacterium GWB2_42_7]OGP34015.1 MAG: pilus assembly protein PilC [Deltaproteobacteria bacterium GWC2_42_51]OGP37862.1 MAG: pilus assembly protein PilC [Deltaproteobacteria bacterium GWD2_42_10]OGP48012.1 MAG: pilus assembly protein PilC [Deltaproteobacteria bacterium GWF2_42_12]OGQ29767.1 MAG: pilus assembly protein PilC [Deltaproteobacteria bacterium RI